MKNLTSHAQDLINQTCTADATKESVFFFFTEHCVCRTASGIRVGIEEFLCHQEDWFGAFPDFRSEIVNIQSCKHEVICKVNIKCTHINPFKNTHISAENVILKYDFSHKLAKLKPSGKRISHQAEYYLTFENNKVSRFLVLEDIVPLYQQLGMRKNILLSKKSEYQKLSHALQNTLNVHLTPREIECLALTLSSFSSKHAAQLLSISFRTVETHLRNAYGKLRCSYKDQCLELMYSHNILHLWQELGREVLKQ